MSQFSVISGSEESREQKTYSPPSVAELGSLFELTLGEGASDKWDIGPGWVKD